MARTATAKKKNNSLFFFPLMNPSFFSHLLSSINSPFSRNKTSSRNSIPISPNLTLIFFLSFFILCAFSGFCILTLYPILISQTSKIPHCSSSSPFPPHLLASILIQNDYLNDHGQIFDKPAFSKTAAMVPLPPHGMIMTANLSDEEREFWKQPEDKEGYVPCLDFSLDYRKASAKITKEKRKFLVVAVSGGLNQQRNQIVDAVVIARILEAALVVPVLQVNRIWGDESEFSDIFDVEHFKETLQADVRIVSSLPSSHLVPRQTVENQIPYHISPTWIRARFLRQLNEEGVLILKGIDSKLSKNLSTDLQKLRCKVAFHALRFASPIQDLGNTITRRMWIEGPYIAIHLRLEKDVWIRTGCPTGLGDQYDKIIAKERESYPDFLTDKLNKTQSTRRLAGLCPLNALEVSRLLKGLGAPKTAHVYIAGGEPFGGKDAMKQLMEEFPNVVTKEMLSREEELTPYMNRPSVLAAIDYIVSLSSDVFLPSHGGNMGRAMQGHRAYVGHRKYIKPNKRMMIPLFEGTPNISEEEFKRTVQKLHKYSKGEPEMRNKKLERDVLAYPVPECMCKH